MTQLSRVLSSLTLRTTTNMLFSVLSSWNSKAEESEAFAPYSSSHSCLSSDPSSSQFPLGPQVHSFPIPSEEDAAEGNFLALPHFKLPVPSISTLTFP